MDHENTSSGKSPIDADLDRERRDAGTFRPDPIVVRLNEYMTRNSLSVRDLAPLLDVPYPTLTAGLRGDRPFPSSKEVRRKLAEVLGATGVQVAVWCGLLDIDDFVLTKDFDKSMTSAIRAIREDASLAHLIPADDETIRAWPATAKMTLVQFYQVIVRLRDPNPLELIPMTEVPEHPANTPPKG